MVVGSTGAVKNPLASVQSTASAVRPGGVHTTLACIMHSISASSVSHRFDLAFLPRKTF